MNVRIVKRALGLLSLLALGADLAATNEVHTNNKAESATETGLKRSSLRNLQTVQARYVKISRSGTSTFNIVEVQVFDTSGTNRALASSGATASQSSTYTWGSNQCYASIAINGDTTETGGGGEACDGMAHTVENQQDTWWKVDLGGHYSISHVVIYNRVSCCQDRLSYAAVSLIDQDGNVVAQISDIGNMSGVSTKTLSIAQFTVLRYPTNNPTPVPTQQPIASPTDVPSIAPSMSPSTSPSEFPSSLPSEMPSTEPSKQPSLSPSTSPSEFPSSLPSEMPSTEPSEQPSQIPSISISPTVAPSISSSPTVVTCLPNARKVKIVAMPGNYLQLFTVQVFSSSSGSNLATGNMTAQSTTLENRVASNAVDGTNKYSFSHTAKDDPNAWWEVDLTETMPVKAVYVGQHMCRYAPDQAWCFCHLGGANFTLLDDAENVVAHYSLGLVCAERHIIEFDASYQCETSSPSSSPSASPSRSPSESPSSSPSKRPSPSPSNPPTNAPTQKPTNCPTTNGSSTETVVGIYSQHSSNYDVPETCGNEISNLHSIVLHFMSVDPDFSTFLADTSIESFSDTDLAAKLDGLTFFFMVDIERGLSGLEGWDATSQAILRNYVSNGGNFVMTGTAGSSDATFLNDLFGWDTSSVGCSTVSLNEAAAAGTAWAGNGNLDCPSATDHINCGSASCFPIWGTETSAAVAVFEYGQGKIIYLGFDFYNTGYGVNGYHLDCSNRNSNWVTQALRNSLLYAESISC